jgi:hypothetical protein
MQEATFAHGADETDDQLGHVVARCRLAADHHRARHKVPVGVPLHACAVRQVFCLQCWGNVFNHIKFAPCDIVQQEI